jgi:hypothetical protein
MSACKACGESFRKGRRALVVGDVRGGRRGVVCMRCARGALLLVVVRKRRKKSKRAPLKGDLREVFTGIELEGSS